MLRFPDVSATHICFVYANDIWLVPRDGGTAVPMASPPGLELFPKFSPDGKSVAFVGNYDGNRDLYTMPVTGGVPTRATHHPSAESLSDWTPDGSLLFLTSGLAGLARQQQLFTVAPEGGLPEKLPVPYGGFAAISPDGTWLAYTPHSTDTRTWKRYRGGMATDIWLFNLNDNTSRQITDWEGTDTLPMWVPGGNSGVVYYLSDNGPEHRLNIWSFDVATGAREQVTKFADDDVRWPSIGPAAAGAAGGSIVFQLGPKMMVLDLASKTSREITVVVPGARPRIKARTVDASKYIAGGTISPSGKRVALEARGDIWSLPAKEGVTRNLTRSNGFAERDPEWSPDGKWIAYFSDQSGEYELWIRPSDARPAEKKEEEKEKEEAKDEKEGDDANKDVAKAEEKQPEAEPEAKPPPPVEPRPEPRKLTDLGPGFRMNAQWSPDSKLITFCDQNGRMFLTTVETGETKEIDKDPWMNQPVVSWSGDSQWLAYTRADQGNGNSCVWLYNAKTGEKTQITDKMFPTNAVAFDRKGDWLFMRSQRAVNAPTYSDVDNTYAYVNSEVLLMAPLRKDVKSPWLTRSDEEELKKEDEEKKPDDAKKEEEKKNSEKNGNGKKDEKPADDGVSGTWEGKATGGQDFPPDGIPFTMKIKLGEGKSCRVTVTSAMGTGEGSGTYDKETGAFTCSFGMGDVTVTLTGTIKGQEATGTWTVEDEQGQWTARRTTPDAGPNGNGNGEKKNGKDEKVKEVKIDLEGLEDRAIVIPVTPGNFGQMAVADGQKLIYSRRSARGSGDPAAIKIFDYAGDEKEEKTVVAGGGGFDLSADGKKLAIFRGSAVTIVDAAAGGGKSTTPPTSNMSLSLDPRAEWRQIFADAWRLQRDYFYEPTMHGVDWPSMRQHYGAMIEDCASREDVSWVIAEMISELNIGHAYVMGQGDVEPTPTVGVGMLGCDFELVPHGEQGGGGGGVYRISAIHRGGRWDADARGPLGQPGVDVKVGEYLLAVNGVPVDASKDPWAAFVGLADTPTTITVSDKPDMDGTERQVLVKPAPSETDLRFRAWIEKNRSYVQEKSGGKIGYIYVPNTGIDGQNELYRQFFGQRDAAALIIDERWNGGGQIPSRFIELLYRPITNYWARREGESWPWSPDTHPGPKCMLINGLAGSGGDCFPWYFKYFKIGKLIGTRTWGGLVGISGNPAFIDGGTMSVPTFGFFELDGTWGVEGHGVDPDIVVIDDPAKMQNGADPQLDAAIAHLLEELKTKAYVPPQRPPSPDRSGMGLPEKDR
jgi:tricorn protease-like protein/C-terminal processing protease CtpA/Prc